MGGKKSTLLLIKKGIKEGKVLVLWVRKITRKIEKPKSASSQTDEVSSSDGESTSKMASTSNTLSKSNTVSKERNKISKGDGAVSKKYNKKNMQNPIQYQVKQINFLLQMENI